MICPPGGTAVVVFVEDDGASAAVSCDEIEAGDAGAGTDDSGAS